MLKSAHTRIREFYQFLCHGVFTSPSRSYINHHNINISLSKLKGSSDNRYRIVGCPYIVFRNLNH